MSLGYRIASMRGYRRLTQGELGARIGVAKQTVCNWENGTSRPNVDLIRAICIAIDCSADYLLELTDNPIRRSE